MAVKYFIAKLNWRQILFHFVAMWLFAHAFKLLVNLYDTKYVDTIMNDKSKFWDRGVINEVYFLIAPFIAQLIGLVVAFVMSFIISLKKHWFWINSLIASLVLFLLIKNDLLGWDYVRFIFLLPGYVFDNWILRLTINGLFLLVLGVYVFFSPRLNRFISIANQK